MKKSYRIIHEDEDIIVLNKSAKVLSIPDRFDPIKPNLKALLLRRYDEIYVVHRLDVETSGVMVFARSAAAHAHLSEQWKNQEVDKYYLALCLGPMEDSGTIDAAIAEHQSKKGRYITARQGKQASTDYEIVKRLGRYALVRLKIYTGRTHQIRVHMKHIGAPLMTDSKYGLHEAFYLSQIKKIRLKRDEDERPLMSRSSLHAAELSFVHPSTGERHSYSAPMPKDMKAVIFQLEK